MSNLTQNSGAAILLAENRQQIITVNDDQKKIAAAIEEFFTPQRMAIKDLSTELAEDSRSVTLSNGISATIWDKDVSQNAPSVLLVHGWGGNSGQLSRFVSPLLKHDMRVVAIDQLAHGRSPGQNASCTSFADGIMLAQEELGPFKHVIGHSLGAASILLAVHQGLKLASAVLISPPSIILVMEYFVAHKGLPSRLLEPMMAAGEDYVGKMRGEVDSVLLSKKVNLPLLLIHDSKDRRCPIAVSQKLAADKDNRRLVTTEGLGHHHIIESEDVVNEAVKYLADFQA